MQTPRACRPACNVFRLRFIMRSSRSVVGFARNLALQSSHKTVPVTGVLQYGQRDSALSR